MKPVYSKFRRGDVWYIKLKQETGDNQDKSSVQKKSRPYLIVSCEQNNNCAPTLNVVPITTRPHDHLPMHVYYNYEGRHQLILCEQITTLSVLDFNNTGSDYMYSFNIEFMNQVDDALAAQLGLKPRVADMSVLENLIDKISADKEAELKRKYENAIQSRVEVIAAKLAQQFNIKLDSQDILTGSTYRPEELMYASKEVKEQLAETAAERTTPHVPDTDVDEMLTQDTVTETAESSTISDKPKRRNQKWTTTAMKAFVDDYTTLSINEIAEKYNVAKKSVANYACTFKKRLNSAE